MASPPNSDSGADIPTTRPANWWKTAHSVNLTTVDSRVKESLNRIAPHGRRCLITCETSPPNSIQTCHLVPKATKSPELRKLQYAWGRKFTPDNRWNLLYLRSDIHNGFDDGAWALVPEHELVIRIRAKITAEIARRLAEKITGAWPDFRSQEWFPSKTNTRHNYHFVALKHYEFPPVITRRKLPEEQTPSATVYYAPYSNFPVVVSHIHPYMAIMNAYPKLRVSFEQLPDEIRAMMADLGIIYSSWQTAFTDAGSVTSAASSQPSIHTGGSGSNRSGLRSQARTRPGTNNAGATTHSAGSSGPHREHGGSFDAIHEDMPSILSNSTPDDSASCQDPILLPPISTCSALGQAGDPLEASRVSSTRVANRVVEWIQEVAAARICGELETVADRPVLDPVEEKARVPPTDDWHSWRSEYAPWYVLLPKNRGLLSSNDWVEVKNYPPLTRSLDDTS